MSQLLHGARPGSAFTAFPSVGMRASHALHMAGKIGQFPLLVGSQPLQRGRAEGECVGCVLHVDRDRPPH